LENTSLLPSWRVAGWEIYLAVAQGPARFSKLAVLKELKPELVQDPHLLGMFLEEARLAARLNHQNIV
jgi:hypothetical protein